MILSAALLCGCAQPTSQRTVSTPAAPSAVASIPTPAPARPAVTTLPGAICERARDGETILVVQTAVNRLMPRIQVDPAYGGGWFEHAPCYRIVIAFKDGKPRQWVIDAADPELRPYIAFDRTRFSHAEREQAGQEIRMAVAAAGIPSMFFSSVKPEQFTLTVRTEAEVPVARQAIPPRYNSDVIVLVGSIDRQPERR